jgi:hypothetical protein
VLPENTPSYYDEIRSINMAYYRSMVCELTKFETGMRDWRGIGKFRLRTDNPIVQ